MDKIKGVINNYQEQPTLLVAHSWYATIFMAGMVTIVAISNAATNDSAGKAENTEASFSAIWSMFVLLTLAIGGTYIMRQHRTPHGVGLLLGFCFMVSQLFFVLFVIYAGFSQQSTDIADAVVAGSMDDGVRKEKMLSAASSDGWFAFFSFVTFLVTLFFSLVLGKHRYEIIPIDTPAGGVSCLRRLSLQPRVFN